MLGGHEGSLLDVYGGEWKFDNYTCSLLNSRGSDNGVTIRYGKNLVSLQQEENIATTITGIVPYWKATDSNDCVYANPVYASNTDNYPYKRTEIIDFSDQFEAKPTSAQLTVLAQQYIEKNNIGHPSVSLDVDFVNLADTEEYKGIAPLENVLLCDTVTVIFEKLGISEKAKVVKTEYDCLAERYKSVEIGTIRSSLAVTIADQGSAIEVTLEKAREFTKDATGWLTNGAGYVIANKNADGSWKELLFAIT
jgi:phage minor structural protein